MDYTLKEKLALRGLKKERASVDFQGNGAATGREDQRSEVG